MKNRLEKCFRISNIRLLSHKVTGELGPVEVHFDFYRYQKARWKYRQILGENYKLIYSGKISAFKLCMNRFSHTPWELPLYQEAEREKDLGLIV